MRHPSYASSLFSRPPCSNEELMMMRLDEFVQKQQHTFAASSPSISSPDSHNSDSSIEIGDKRSSTLNKPNKHTSKQLSNQQLPLPATLDKELFLPTPFGGFSMMPPPGFLPPPANFFFSSYHNALYEQNHPLFSHQQQVQQSLLKRSDFSLLFSSKSPSSAKEIPNFEGDNDVEDVQNYELNGKKIFSDASLESQNSLLIKVTESSQSLHLIVNKSDSENMEINKEKDVLTPPRSPKSPVQNLLENYPIDLSLKGGSSTKSDDINHNYCKTANSKANNKSSSDNFMNETSDSDSDDHKTNSVHKKTVHCHDLKDGNNGKRSKLNHISKSEDDSYGHNNISDDNSDDFEKYRQLKRRKLLLLAPLDLTTKI